MSKKGNPNNKNDKNTQNNSQLQNITELVPTSESLSNFLSFMRNISSQYRMAVTEEQETDDITQDIMHSLELEDHTYHEYAQLSKELSEVRKKRRMAKDTLAVLKPVLDWYEKNTQVIKDLENLLGVVRKSEQKFNNRIYTPKTNNVSMFAAKTSGKGNLTKGNNIPKPEKRGA